MGSNETRPTKLTYRSPVVHVYGSIRAMTMNVSMTGTLDGGPKSKKTA